MNRRQFHSLLVAGAVIGSAGASFSQIRPKLLLVHGRDQAALDPEELKADWLAALSKGAEAIGRTLPAPLDVSFPFYGDILENFAKQTNLPLTPDIKARGGEGQNNEFLAFEAEVAESIRQRLGVPDEEIMKAYGENPKARGPLNWEWVQAILIAIDKHATGLSSAAIEHLMRDVFLYTTRKFVRDAVDDEVRKHLTGDPTIVVGHSLGSVVAYNVLTDQAASQIPLFVTIGSPLGINAIRNQLMPLAFPANVSAWFNAFDPRDVVALFPLDEENFPVTPTISNFGNINNDTPNRHGIIGYLDDTKVAGDLLDAL